MKFRGLCVVIGMAVVMSGCGTDRVVDQEVVSTTTTETTVTTTVVETKTVSATQAPVSVSVPVAVAPVPVPVPVSGGGGQQTVSCEQGVDILAGAKKPCGTIAADAPKFVNPSEAREK